MPGSTVSGGGSQTSSTASRRARTRHYYKVAHTSQVDENLFGAPHHETQRDEMLQEKWNPQNGGTTGLEKEAAKRGQRKKSGGKKGSRETVQVITKDLIRNLVVPEGDPSGQSLVMSYGDFLRVREAARILTKEERAAAELAAKADKEQLLEEAEDRKMQMKLRHQEAMHNEALNELEEEAKKKSEHLRQAAEEKRQEQEDEIKHLNELILNAKCHVIRDAQILERDQIKSEMSEEEKRLDAMMEADRQNAISIEEVIEKKRREERLLGACKLMDQIQEAEQERLLDLERKDQENVQMQQYLQKLVQEEAEKLTLRQAEQEDLREELNKCNSELVTKKKLEGERERVLEEQVMEYQKQKAERDAEFEKEQERIRIEKEREVARLRAQQERARDEQAERDALKAKRAQEQAEREWRMKEAEEAARKAATEAMLNDARAKQKDMKEHFLAVQAQREKVDFERVLKVQQELVEKENELENDEKSKRIHHREDVLAQIREKEKVKIHERNQFFEEGIKLTEEARHRRGKMDEVKKKKLDELRSAGIPEKYLTQIERKINQPQQLSA